MPLATAERKFFAKKEHARQVVGRAVLVAARGPRGHAPNLTPRREGLASFGSGAGRLSAACWVTGTRVSMCSVFFGTRRWEACGSVVQRAFVTCDAQGARRLGGPGRWPTGTPCAPTVGRTLVHPVFSSFCCISTSFRCVCPLPFVTSSFSCVCSPTRHLGWHSVQHEHSVVSLSVGFLVLFDNVSSIM